MSNAEHTYQMTHAEAWRRITSAMKELGYLLPAGQIEELDEAIVWGDPSLVIEAIRYGIRVRELRRAHQEAERKARRRAA